MHVLVKESLEAEMKKLEKMPEKVKNMRQQHRCKDEHAKKGRPFSLVNLVGQCRDHSTLRPAGLR